MYIRTTTTTGPSFVFDMATGIKRASASMDIDTRPTKSVSWSAKKSKRPMMTIVPAKQLDLHDGIVMGNPSRGKMTVITLYHKKGGPLMVELTGGGDILTGYGYKVKKYSEDSIAQEAVTFTVNDVEEKERLHKFVQDCTALINERNADWKIPLPEDTTAFSVRDLFRVPKPREDGSASKLPPTVECVLTKSPKVCKVDKTAVEDLNNIKGMSWTKMRFELKSLCITGNGTFSISRRLHLLHVAPGKYFKVGTVDEYNLSSPDDMWSATKAIQNLHITKEHISHLSNDKVKLVILKQPENDGPLCFELQGGGRVANWDVEKDMSGDPKLALVVSGQDDDQDLRRLGVETMKLADDNRDEWVPGFNGDLQYIFSNLITDRKPHPEKEDMVLDGICKGKVQKNKFRLKRGSTEIDTSGAFDLDSLKGCKWTRAVFEIPFVYIQGKKQFGLSKRIRFLELEETNDDYVMPCSDDEIEVDV